MVPVVRRRHAHGSLATADVEFGDRGMSFKTITRSDGTPAEADDMSPRLRAFALLLEHANLRDAAGLTPTACPCPECERNRATLRALRARPA